MADGPHKQGAEVLAEQARRGQQPDTLERGPLEEDTRILRKGKFLSPLPRPRRGLPEGVVEPFRAKPRDDKENGGVARDQNTDNQGIRAWHPWRVDRETSEHHQGGR